MHQQDEPPPSCAIGMPCEKGSLPSAAKFREQEAEFEPFVDAILFSRRFFHGRLQILNADCAWRPMEKQARLLGSTDERRRKCNAGQRKHRAGPAQSQ